jgi:hypothetical protein
MQVNVNVRKFRLLLLLSCVQYEACDQQSKEHTKYRWHSDFPAAWILDERKIQGLHFFSCTFESIEHTTQQ